MNSFQSIIESVGTYLPPNIVTTAEVLEGCVSRVRVPLERLTGIKSRHFAEEKEFAIDLATKAIDDCLKHSRIAKNQFDLLISANISRYDGLNVVGYEPSTAIALKKLMGFDQAIAFDISNACASMWTAVYVADKFIASGAVRNALVVSGEYISHLTRTAQLEIDGYMDSQLASLTLGDAGVAVALCGSQRSGEGFNELDLYTLGAYSRLCIAKPSDKPHGGAVMYTDAVKVTAAIVPHAAAHAVHTLRQSGRHVDDVQHIIPHQTSRMTIRGALDEIAKEFDSDCSAQMIDNLEVRGNTASTTHFLAYRDQIDNGRIRTGDQILFAISGSGQTTGTAIYTCNDLPDRIRAANANQSVDSDAPSNRNGELSSTDDTHDEAASVELAMAVPFRFESIATAYPNKSENTPSTPPDTLAMLCSAAKQCIEQGEIDRSTIELIISVGVYRSEFMTEPALAALLAGDLDINADQPAEDPIKTFAFDLLNGSMGFLNACHLICEMGRAGEIERAMVVASEIENNAAFDGKANLGLTEMASAVILSESDDGETGFHAFHFDHYPEHQDAYHVVANLRNELGKTYLETKIESDWKDRLIPAVGQSVERFLQSQDLSIDDIDWLLPSPMSNDLRTKLGDELGIPVERMIFDADATTDAFTSAVPLAMLASQGHPTTGRHDRLPASGQWGLPASGQWGLIVQLSSGLQVGCALYRF
ncbi:3-oxoacyl-[acyl-carrier-protein] synthase III C-terminal domain-containing protein [Neorhodopirellula pilleata]|uniref:3-oxoacyl-[acyl-carrier-protein] synthase 3 n=1 Tax=Neorhodopirellula pilleata TaxID=2714738 RepID=A0A5C6ATG1_9BACT|nr:3-oxoacyl-[acyl-carrier-protein] synthase III C-terminal domain-containing protein [Neorhodopirellula pilleata]TWU03333.1 3-oxoacyl-[acyl-carrier-protein] synthase 3 [Neorhodopirellula pilleata]